MESLNKQSPGLGDQQLLFFEKQGARIYASQIAAGKGDDAKTFAQTLLELRDTPTMRVALVEACVNINVGCPEAAIWLDQATKSGADVSALRQRAATQHPK
ncbi:MAG: hypothetical protein U0573_05260 [Phycisphaerales bacterium]|nr:hypothetical protein [Planctomycetota bacterium]